jgi:hypothetical protein
MKLDKTTAASRTSIFRAVLALLLIGIFAYLLWLPLFYLFSAFNGLLSHRHKSLIVRPGDE